MKPSTDEQFDKEHYYATRWPEQKERRPPESAYGVPRRFGMRAVCVAMTFVSLLVALLSRLGVNPGIIFILGAISLAVLAAQLFLFSGRHRRLASIIAGSSLSALFVTIASLIQFQDLPGPPGWNGFLTVVFAYSVAGGILGYVVGWCFTFVFWFEKVVDQKRRKRTSTEKGATPLKAERG